MEFISRHKGYFAVATAIAAAIGVGLYFGRKGNAKETLPPNFDEPSLSSIFASKIEAIRTKNNKGPLSEEEIASIAEEYAGFIEQRTREIEQGDYLKAKECKQARSFADYVQNVLLLQKDKETQTQTLLRQQQEMLQNLNLSEDQKMKIVSSSALIFSQRVATKVSRQVIQLARNLLALKTEYLRAEGKSIIKGLVEASAGWDDANLVLLPNILNVIVNEAVCSANPAFLDNLLETSWAIETTPEQMEGELKAWEETILPVFEELTAQLEKTRK